MYKNVQTSEVFCLQALLVSTSKQLEEETGHPLSQVRNRHNEDDEEEDDDEDDEENPSSILPDWVMILMTKIWLF